ncbi:MAG: antitoxin Xre-like helix-turn-helix domain-containing protein, partial [Rhodoplanes sp.]
MPGKPRPDAVIDQAAVLTKAALRAATQLGITNKLLAAVIGVSEATVSRMRSGDYTLQRGQKPFELAVLFVR